MARCAVQKCEKRAPLRGGEFCANHIDESNRRAVYLHGYAGERPGWYAKCVEGGCNDWVGKPGKLCWKHEALRFPQYVCAVDGCDQRADWAEKGGRYCWEHNQEHNPYWPEPTAKAHRRSMVVQVVVMAAMVVVFVPLGLWFVVFVGTSLFTPSEAACASGSYWTWGGERCDLSQAEYEEEIDEWRDLKEWWEEDVYESCLAGDSYVFADADSRMTLCRWDAENIADEFWDGQRPTISSILEQRTGS